MIRLIDTHTHLYDEEFAPELDEVVARAKSKGVLKVIMPGIDRKYHNTMASVAHHLKGFAFCAAGLHPTSVKQNWESELSFVYEKFAQDSYCAVGEIGMDGYWSKEYLKEQSFVFKSQLELADKYDVPVIIHSRESTEDIFTVLESCKHLTLRGVFHAFSGSYETYQRIKKYGDFKIGIGGVVTYKNSHLPEVVKKVGMEDIVLETDSPWLTPVPHRGTRNEPSYIELIATKIASIKETTLEEVAHITTINAEKLFKI